MVKPPTVGFFQLVMSYKNVEYSYERSTCSQKQKNQEKTTHKDTLAPGHRQVIKEARLKS